MTLTTALLSTKLANFGKYFTTHLQNFSNRPLTHNAEEYAYMTAVILTTFAAGYGIRLLTVLILKKSLSSLQSSLATIRTCSHIIPPLIVIIVFPFAFDHFTPRHSIIMRCFCVYLFITVAIALNAVISLIWSRYNSRHNAKNLPINGIPGTAKGFVWLVTIICSIALIINKSPITLLTGLGAFAAALMLIFRDSILGLVAGITLAQNDMLHVGDWIIVPSTTADGVVIDVSLTVVKVQNRDLTLVMLPPYTLVSTSFINYRNIYSSNNRLLDTTIYIDPLSVTSCTTAQLEDIARRLPSLAPFISSSPTATHHEDTAINGSTETNLGLFRAYMSLYLRDSPLISKQHLLIVRLLDMTPHGIPLNLYCFTADARLKAFEAISATVVEHAIASLPLFNLNISTTAHININHND